MAVLGIIPARSGSKRIPNKNKKLFCGKPLIHYIIQTALKSELLDTIVVNSDDKDILNISKDYAEIIPLERPAEIAQDHSKAIEYIHHTIAFLGRQRKIYETVVILQPTSPLTLPKDIDHTVELLKSSGADSAVSVVELEHAIHPIKMKVMEGNKLVPFLEEENGRMAAHELPKIFVRNCSVYVSTMKTIEGGNVIGKDCRGYIMPAERSVDINSQMDFEFAEFLYKKKF